MPINQSTKGMKIIDRSPVYSSARARWAVAVVGWIALCVPSPQVPAEVLHLAVAASMLPVVDALIPVFERDSGHTVRVSGGSTGRLYAQVTQGAPFELLLAADEETPQRLVQQGRAPGGMRVYAIGRLALWGRQAGAVSGGLAALCQQSGRRLALANPDLAPYGRAARQALEASGRWQACATRVVYGEDVGQAFQFAATGNVDAALVPLAQVRLAQERGIAGVYRDVAPQLHAPLRHAFAILQPSAAAVAFADFMLTPSAQVVLQRYGYALPP